MTRVVGARAMTWWLLRVHPLTMQDLQGCANTLIGDEILGMKGVSGGQKRRVSLAIDLVKVGASSPI